MYKRMIMGAAALALLAGVAVAAQDAANSPPPQDDNSQFADNAPPPPPPPPGDGQDEGWGGGWRHWKARGQGGPHPGMMGLEGPGGPGGRGGMGMMMRMKGFRMNLGRGVNVDVACGQEAIKDCIASAQPLIDAAKTAAAALPAGAPKTP